MRIVDKYTLLSKAMVSDLALCIEIAVSEDSERLLLKFPPSSCIFLRQSTQGITRVLNSVAKSFHYVGFVGIDSDPYDLDDYQLTAERSAATMVVMELQPPNLRCNVIECCQRRRLLCLCKVPASLNLEYLEQSSLKYGISSLQLLTKGLLQMGVVVVMPVSLIATHPHITMLCHPFATRRLFNSASKVYRLLIEEAEMDLLRERSWEREDEVYCQGSWNPNNLLPPSPRPLTYDMY